MLYVPNVLPFTFHFRFALESAINDLRRLCLLHRTIARVVIVSFDHLDMFCSYHAHYVMLAMCKSANVGNRQVR